MNLQAFVRQSYAAYSYRGSVTESFFFFHISPLPISPQILIRLQTKNCALMILSEFGHASTNQKDRVTSSRLLTRSINQKKLRSTRLPGSLHCSELSTQAHYWSGNRTPARLVLPGPALVAAMKMLSVCDTSRWPPTRALLRYTDCQCDACSRGVSEIPSFSSGHPCYRCAPGTLSDNARLQTAWPCDARIRLGVIVVIL